MRTICAILCAIIFVAILLSGCKKRDSDFPIPPPVFNPDLKYGSMTDQEGNVYKTITIGTQTWMAENLRTIHYRNGLEINKVVDSTEWRKLKTGAYCDYNNTILTGGTLGKLYNGYTINDSLNIAPEGWHVPSGSEWTTLSDYLGGENVAGSKLEEAGTVHWVYGCASNESGFTALPGGLRDYTGFFSYISTFGWWWSSTEYTENFYTNVFYTRSLCNFSEWFGKTYNGKTEGLSIRCIRD